MTAPVVRTLATTVHGRYLTITPASPPRGLLVGFHGYAENADVHAAALRGFTRVGCVVLRRLCCWC